MIEAILAISLSVGALQVPPQDSVRARRDAERAAFRYEYLLRQRAPVRLGGGGGTDCDEVIGRFCFTFGEDEASPRDTMPDPPEVEAARIRAIRTHRSWFAVAPASPDAVGALLRYLVEAGRSGEAVAAARTHAWASRRTPESLLLLGLALHEDGAFAEAEAVFDTVRARVSADERERLDDLSMLVEPREARRYRELSVDEREAYQRRFWAFADPSALQPGNERRSAHYARHAWASVMERAPRAPGRSSWRADTEEILLRYGLPARRERIREPLGRPGARLSMVEYFGPRTVSFVPPALLTEGLDEAPEPGESSPLERRVVRSSYTPVRLDRPRGMPVQAARFPVDGGAVLVVSGRLPVDTTGPPPAAPRGLLVVTDTLGREVDRAPARARVLADSTTVVDGEVAVGSGAYVYRLEVVDDSTGAVGLAQYRIDVPSPGTPALSDLLVAAPDSLADSRETLSPSPDLVVAPDRPLLIWAEVDRLARRDDRARYAVEWWAESAESGTLLGRAVRWLGRRIGLGGSDRPVRLRWEDASSQRPIPIRFTVDLADLDPGLYRLGLTVTDRISGLSATSTRVIRLDPEAAPLWPRP